MCSAIVQQQGEWRLRWINDNRWVNCQERTCEELADSLRAGLNEISL